MKFSTLILAASLAASARALPLTKRIAQVISASTTKWEAACDAAGGGEQCNPTAVTAFTTLLAAAGPCDQQNAADSMVDLAKQLNQGDDSDMIKFAQIFAQQPRNSPNSLSIPYCQQAPNNTQLAGLFQCQYQGSNPTTFVGNIQVGAAGTLPFGMTTALSPAGSCKAHPSGPIADGTQLTDITSDPGVGAGASASGSASATVTAATAEPSDDCDDGDDGDESETVVATTTIPANAASASAIGASLSASAASVGASLSASAASVGASLSSAAVAQATGTSSGGFALANGQAAQALNAKFATLSASEGCTDGTTACISGSFAQCANGAYVLSACNTAAGLTCAALPLVNSPGTSVTCTTMEDAVARIARTGAVGGLVGSG